MRQDSRLPDIWSNRAFCQIYSQAIRPPEHHSQIDGRWRRDVTSLSVTAIEAQPVAWTELWRILLKPRPDVFDEPEQAPISSDEDQDESTE